MDQYFSQGTHCIIRKIGDETLLIPMSQIGYDTQRLYTLNEVSSDIWNFIEKPHTLEEIVQFLLKSYDAKEKEICKEVDVFLKNLESLELIKITTE